MTFAVLKVNMVKKVFWYFWTASLEKLNRCPSLHLFLLSRPAEFPQLFMSIVIPIIPTFPSILISKGCVFFANCRSQSSLKKHNNKQLANNSWSLEIRSDWAGLLAPARLGSYSHLLSKCLQDLVSSKRMPSFKVFVVCFCIFMSFTM